MRDPAAHDLGRRAATSPRGAFMTIKRMNYDNYDIFDNKRINYNNYDNLRTTSGAAQPPRLGGVYAQSPY